MLLLLLACDDGQTTKVGLDTSSEQPADADADGWTDAEGDCDEGDPDVHPGATELCNGLDDDCDEVIDEGVMSLFYADADGDGAGDPEASVASCAASSGYVENGNDCDDEDAAVHPGADESCNGIDDDCDGSVDEDVGEVVYADADGDGWGDPDSPGLACTVEAGWAAEGGDCDDADAAVSPDAVEVCNEVDDDCDGSTDEEPADGIQLYTDADLDGWGDATAGSGCDAGYAESLVGGDCDDLDPSAWPGATEGCDGVDNDCDGVVDEESDEDGDGVTGCGGDCDDGDATVFPGAAESCDGSDEDCDGDIDEGAGDMSAWYADADADGYGSETSVEACAAPEGFVDNAEDCDDADDDVNPGEAERCSGVDDDCDGEVDEGFDADGDGFASCDGDCDDADPEVHEGAVETCDGVDEDCDGGVDEGATDPATWYNDADGDGHGDAADATEACEAPAGWVADPDDCDDADADAFPGNVEDCDGHDENCDGYPDDGGVCPCDVDWYEGGTYMFCASTTDGVTARAECVAYNYHLVRIDDADEDDWLRTEAPEHGGGDWWIGLTDEIYEGLFGWVWGAMTVPYENWESGEPNDLDGEDCVTLGYGGSAAWVDQDCAVTTTWICEAD